MSRPPPVNSRREAFVDLALDYADDDSHGYSQKPPSGRWGPDYDCSSLLYFLANEAGYPVGSGGDKVRFTGTMLKDFKKAGFQNAIGYENLATSNEVQRGFDNQNSMSNQREILAAINSNSLQGMQNSNQNTQYITGQVMDKYNELERDIYGIATTQQAAIANQNQCCCDTKMLISETAANQRYESAMQNNATIQAIREEGNATRAMIQNDKIEALQQKVNNLELQNAMNGVVRYPQGLMYSAGQSPFCNCGWNNCCNMAA